MAIRLATMAGMLFGELITTTIITAAKKAVISMVGLRRPWKIRSETTPPSMAPIRPPTAGAAAMNATPVRSIPRAWTRYSGTQVSRP